MAVPLRIETGRITTAAPAAGLAPTRPIQIGPELSGPIPV
jgi:hypothetical protein